MAGSGIRGAFEEKFKALVKDIEEEASTMYLSCNMNVLSFSTQAGNVICFIDELREQSTGL